MSSTYLGLNIAASGLLAEQTAMDVVAHNIANVNNPDFHRQQAVPVSAPPYGNGGTEAGTLGSGVQVSVIQRMKDQFVEAQLLISNQQLGSSQSKQQALDQVVTILGEPSDQGFSSDLDKMFSAFQQLSVNPSDPTARVTVVQTAGTVAADLNRLSSQIQDLSKQQDQSIQAGVTQVNQLAVQLAALNAQIQSARGAGQAPNDLLDQRSALLAKLSSLVDVQVHGEGGSGDILSVAGHVLVQGDRTEVLTTGADAAGHATVLWAADSSAASIGGGQLGGTLELVRGPLPAYLSSLDHLAQGLISSVNALHKAGAGSDGVTGRDFFSGQGAGDISVNPALAADPQKVAASATGAPGDGSTALAIARLKSQPGSGKASAGDSYRTLVTAIGSDAGAADRSVAARTQIQQQLLLQQQSASGISLDQEMADMVRFQQAYEASARMITTIDTMLDTLIHHLGITGT